MNCLEFRKKIYVEPGSSDAACRAHMSECSACSAFAMEMEAFDQLLGEALQVPVPDQLADFSLDEAGRPEPGPSKARAPWFAMAASLMVAALVIVAALQSGGDDSIATELVAHVRHEPASLLRDAAPVPAADIEYVLQRTGARFEAPVGTVTYMKTCPFRNREVAHVVIRGETGPVTLMLLPHIHVDVPEAFEEDGLKGTIVPVGEGSVAIISETDEPLEPVQEQVSRAVAWRI